MLDQLKMQVYYYFDTGVLTRLHTFAPVLHYPFKTEKDEADTIDEDRCRQIQVDQQIDRPDSLGQLKITLIGICVYVYILYLYMYI